MVPFLVLMGWIQPSFAADHPETSHLAFVSEYVRELAENEAIRAATAKEMAEAKSDNERFAVVLHGDTTMQLALQTDIRMLAEMTLKEPFETLIPSVVTFYQQKIELKKQLDEDVTAFLSEPKPDVDYGKLQANVVQVRASLEFVEKSLFEVSPLVFGTLIDPKADSHNHCNHLIITKAERATLLKNINDDFGKAMESKNQPYPVAAASVLKGDLLKGFKGSDEPWE